MMADISRATPAQLAELQKHKARLARINAASIERKPAVKPAPPIEQVAEPRPEPPPFPFPWIPTSEIDLGRITVDQILKVVCRDYGLARGELIANRRTAKVVRPRQVAMYLAKELTLRSLPDIGRRFGGRDHTTVLYAVRKVAGLIETDAEFAGRIDALRRELGANDA